MEDRDLVKHLNRTSQFVERKGSGYMCTLCGVTARTLSDLSHTPECPLGMTMAEAMEACTPACIGSSDIPQDAELEIMSMVTPEVAARVDAFIDRLLEVKTGERRMVVTQDIAEAFPRFDKAMLGVLAATGIQSEQHRLAVRMAMLFEAVFQDQEKELMRQVDVYVKTGDNYQKIKDAAVAAGITNGIK